MNFSKLAEFIDTISENCRIPSCDCSVYYQHREVFRRRSGFVDLEKTKPTSGSDLYFLYSASKVCLAVAAMQLVEKGLLSLHDPVGMYLPEFHSIPVWHGSKSFSCKKQATIEHLLAMQAGLDYQFTRPDIMELARRKPNASTQEFIHQYLTELLQFEPGERFLYSMCHDVLGAVIEIVTNMRYSDYVKKNIAQPLGMNDLEFRVLSKNRERMVQQYTWKAGEDPYDIWGADIVPLDKMDCFTVFGPEYDSAGGGAVCSVSDYVLLADALANWGVGANGVRILSPESICQMRKDRLCNVAYTYEEYPQARDYGYGYGLGVRTLVNNRNSRSPIGEFGWDGAAGAYFLSDVDNQIAIFSATSVCDMYPLARVFHTKCIRDLTYEAILGDR